MEQIRLTLTVPDGTRDRLARAARWSSRSRANLVALLLEEYLDSRKGDDE
jgi:hypothetical protein